jgi:hypothetical protein
VIGGTEIMKEYKLREETTGGGLDGKITLNWIFKGQDVECIHLAQERAQYKTS